jgi:hypothetical protein
MQAMMKDQFANYVVQKVLETCDESQRELLLGRIRVHLHALKKYTYGKHIVARVEKLVAAGGELCGPIGEGVACNGWWWWWCDDSFCDCDLAGGCGLVGEGCWRIGKVRSLADGGSGCVQRDGVLRTWHITWLPESAMGPGTMLAFPEGGRAWYRAVFRGRRMWDAVSLLCRGVMEEFVVRRAQCGAGDEGRQALGRAGSVREQ